MIAKIRLGFIGAALTLTSGLVDADTLDSKIQEAARTQQDTVAVIHQQPVEIIFVGQYRGCGQVSVLWHDRPQQNFEICGQAVRDKRSVAPTWPTDHGSRAVLALVVDRALLQGQFQATDPNGYLISAKRLADIGVCATLSVNISYAGDLVDRDLRRICH